MCIFFRLKVKVSGFVESCIIGVNNSIVSACAENFNAPLVQWETDFSAA